MASDNEDHLDDLEVDAPAVVGGSQAAPPTPGQLGDRVRDEAHGVVSPESRPAHERPDAQVSEPPDLTP